MSYSTRRTGGIPGNQQANSVGGIGQRRPVVTNNFVPGGTINTGPGQVKSFPGNQQHQRQPGAQNNTTIHFRNQQHQQQFRPQVKSEPQQRQPQNQQVPPQNQSRQVPPPAQVQQPFSQPQQQAEQKVFPAPQQQQQKAPVEQKVFPAAQQQQQKAPIEQKVFPAAQQQQQQQKAPVEQKVFPTQQQQKAPIEPIEQKVLPTLQQPAQVELQQPPLKNEVAQPSQPENGGGEAMEISDNEPQQQLHYQPRRKTWHRRPNIPRREMIRRRNFRLSKMLKPKNAVAILNEIIKNLSYEVETVSNRSDGRTFKASVTYDGTVHEGFGFSEDQAKNGAAEVVLKYYIKSNKMGELKKTEDTPETMDVTTEDENVPLPWHHVASFAIYKLFSQWEEDPNLVGISASYLNVKQETKQSKKMPPNPETINPLMLLNQMMPQARFEEIGRSGNPPQIIFSFRCTVDNNSFVGRGTSKKIAKRAAAFEACYKLLDVKYPPDIFVPSDYI